MMASRKAVSSARGDRRILILSAFVVLATQAFGQSAHFGCSAPVADTVITTDRPAFTNASTVVPCLSVQVESGMLLTAFAPNRAVDFPEVLLRFGMTNTIELRFSAPDYVRDAQSSTGQASGAGDLSIGVKQQLGPIHGTDISILANLSLPSGATALTSHGYDAQVQAPWSRKLSTNWTAAGMLSTAWPTINGQHRVTGQASLLLDRQVTAPLDMFIEYSGNYPMQGRPQHILHFGAAYKVGSHQQIDLHGGVGFAGYPADNIVGAGYSIRFDFRHAPVPKAGHG